MEFYSSFLDYSSDGFCFNSQRDGILLIHYYFIRLAVWVSIPNGMEFYLNSLGDIVTRSDRFNSQRDGILL